MTGSELSPRRMFSGAVFALLAAAPVSGVFCDWARVVSTPLDLTQTGVMPRVAEPFEVLVVGINFGGDTRLLGGAGVGGWSRKFSPSRTFWFDFINA